MFTLSWYCWNRQCISWITLIFILVWTYEDTMFFQPLLSLHGSVFVVPIRSISLGWFQFVPITYEEFVIIQYFIDERTPESPSVYINASQMMHCLCLIASTALVIYVYYKKLLTIHFGIFWMSYYQAKEWTMYLTRNLYLLLRTLAPSIITKVIK